MRSRPLLMSSSMLPPRSTASETGNQRGKCRHNATTLMIGHIESSQQCCKDSLLHVGMKRMLVSIEQINIADNRGIELDISNYNFELLTHEYKSISSCLF